MQRTSGFYLCWNMGSELSGRTKDFELLNHHCDPIRSHSSVRDKRCSDWLMCQTKNGHKASKQEPKEKTHSLILTIHFRQLLNFLIALFGVYLFTVSPPFDCTSLSQSVCSSLLTYLLFFPFFLPDDFFQYCRFTIGTPWFYSGPIFIRSSWNTLSLYSLIYTKNVFI